MSAKRTGCAAVYRQRPRRDLWGRVVLSRSRTSSLRKRDGAEFVMYIPMVGAQGLEPWTRCLRVSGSKAQDWPKPAITLSRKNWLFCAIGAVLHSIPGDRRASGSCPAGSMAEVGLRWWRRRTPLNRRGDPDVNAKVEAPDPSTAK
jgi:hypothetical protein